MIVRRIFGLASLSMVLLVTGCAGIRPGFEPLSVKVVAFRPLPGEGMAPRFEIGLRVVNPNPDALTLRGMSYTVSLDEFDVVDGAANDLPVVPAYGEAQFSVQAAVSLLDAIRFVNNLMQKPAGQVEYKLRAKLDVGAFAPAIRVEQMGLLGVANGQTE